MTGCFSERTCYFLKKTRDSLEMIQAHALQYALVKVKTKLYVILAKAEFKWDTSTSFIYLSVEIATFGLAEIPVTIWYYLLTLTPVLNTSGLL